MKQPPVITFAKYDPLQSYFCNRNGDEFSVARLVDETKHLAPFRCPIASLNLGDIIWNGKNIIELAYEVQKVQNATFDHPIILDWHGDIADGRHRIIKALVEGRRWIPAVRMTWSIEPCRKAANG